MHGGNAKARSLLRQARSRNSALALATEARDAFEDRQTDGREWPQRVDHRRADRGNRAHEAWAIDELDRGIGDVVERELLAREQDARGRIVRDRLRHVAG